MPNDSHWDTFDPLGDSPADDLQSAIEAAFGPGALSLLADDGVDALGRGGVNTDGLAADAGAHSLADLLRAIDDEAATTTRHTLGSKRRQVAGTENKYVVCALADQLLAVPMANVVEVVLPPPITPLPTTPAWIRGVINLRGTVVSVTDLHQLAELPSIHREVPPRLLVIRSWRCDMTTAILVDRIIGIRFVDRDQIQQPTTIGNSTWDELQAGVVEIDQQWVTVLDIDRLMNSETFNQFETVQ